MSTPINTSKRQFLRQATLPLWLTALPAAVWAQTPVTPAAVVRFHAELVHATYADTLAAAEALQAAVASFVKAPDAAALETARRAWLAAREFYGQTEAFRFYGGPIDDDKGPEGRLNAWPLDEAYIDRIQGRPEAGLINRRSVAITKANLSQLNEKGGEENIAAGWHAIEFMLWGQDQRADGAGQRPASDFIDGQAPNADRRRLYLSVVTELLVDDLRSLVTAWAPGARNYRQRFEAGGTESLRKIIIGLGSLSRGELAGERMEVALNTQDQEDEHSCFSDNTHRDIVNNALGIQNVWLGRCVRRDGSLLQGASLAALLSQVDAALAQRLTQQIALSVTRAQAIQAPFDREIIGGKDAPGRQRVQAVIDSLVAQAKGLVDAAAALGITRLTLVNA